MRHRSLADYKTIIFDCDGVIFDSNKIKTDAFYGAALKYGVENAIRLKQFHLLNAGKSRFLKFKYFSEELSLNQFEEDQLLSKYETIVVDGLKKIKPAFGLEYLREKTINSKWMVVSGGRENELIWLFTKNKIDKLFDAGIYGSPKNKIEIIQDKIQKKIIHGPTVFIGDSAYDYEVSKEFKFDFIFLSDWTELKNWYVYCQKNSITSRKNILDMVYMIQGDTL